MHHSVRRVDISGQAFALMYVRVAKISHWNYSALGDVDN